MSAEHTPTVVAAFLVPGSPLPKLRPDVAPWGSMRSALAAAGKSLRESGPDCVLVYSTQWMAVLDQLWITRPRSTGLHVDENWHEFGELPFDLASDVELAKSCISKCLAAGIKARDVDYDAFPIDTGTITAGTLMSFGAEDLPVVIAANNLYHDATQTEALAALAVSAAREQGKRVAVIGIGSLSNAVFREPMQNLQTDQIHSTSDDAHNRKLLALLEAGNVPALRAALPEYVEQARPDMGLKHLHWILGALAEDGCSERYVRAKVHGYEPLYGSGGAVVEFVLR